MGTDVPGAVAEGEGAERGAGAENESEEDPDKTLADKLPKPNP